MQRSMRGARGCDGLEASPCVSATCTLVRCATPSACLNLICEGMCSCPTMQYCQGMGSLTGDYYANFI